MMPIEVIVREPKRNREDVLASLVRAAILLSVRAGILMLVIPGAMSVLGVEAHPNFGEALLLILMIAFLVPNNRIPYLNATDSNRSLRKKEAN